MDSSQRHPLSSAAGRTERRRWPAALAAAALVLVMPGAGTASAFVQWDDVAAAVGVDFRTAGEIHPAEGFPVWPATPEIFGSGACWGDYDGDGWPDLYIVNQQFNEENVLYDQAWVDEVDPRNKLFINQGDGTFVEAAEAAGVSSRQWNYACSAADYDADGDLDLWVTGFDSTQLFRNDGDGTFTEVAEAAGLDKAGTCLDDFACDSTSSAWADYDGDGDLDLFSVNYIETFLTDIGRGPAQHVGQPNWLFRNDGDGTFTEVAEELGVQGQHSDENGSKSFGLVWTDCDLDGDLDVFVANDETPDEFYRNNGDGTFVAWAADAAIDDPRAGMGVAAGDYDRDGFTDIFITHYDEEDNGFYRNNGDCTYEERSGEDDLRNSWDDVGWGTAFYDFDRDMDLDLMIVNGHTEAFLDYFQPIKVYRQDANADLAADPWDKQWTDVSLESGPAVQVELVHRGAAWADYDLDGDVDLVTVQNANATAQFLLASGVTHHWLLVDLVQPGANRNALGARIEVEAGGVTQWWEVHTGTSFLSQNAVSADFGLGPNAQADRVTVHWPGGGTTELLDVPADRVVRVDRAAGAFVTDTLSPRTRAAVDGVPGDDGWWRSPVSVRLDAADQAVGPASGVASTQYAFGSDAWGPYPGTAIAVGDEGTRLLSYRSLDAVGNAEPRRRETLRVDFTAPSLVVNLDGVRGDNGWWTSPEVTIDLRAADAVSGVDEVRFRIDEGPWQVFLAPFEVDQDGVHTVEFTARDVAGNERPVEAVEIRLDHTPPRPVVVQPSPGHVYPGDETLGGTNAGPAVLLLAPDAAGLGGFDFPVRVQADDATSGLQGLAVHLDGERVAAGAAPTLEWTWETDASPWGLHRVAAVARDMAGNEADDDVPVLLVTASADGALGTLPDDATVSPASPASWWAAPGGLP